MLAKQETGEQPKQCQGAQEQARQTVNNVALLALLTLTAEEQARMERELPQMVRLAEELASLTVDAQGVGMQEKTIATGLRQDVVMQSLPIEAVLANAATVNGRLITVPKTFD